jgi:lipopolysaccharide export system permease protein
MDTLDRYLIRELGVYLILLIFGLGLLFVGIDFLSNFWRSPLPFGTVVLTYVYRIPHAIEQFIPVACLMATLLVLSGMSRQNEILALNASGVGTLRILSTFIALVASVSTASFLVFDPIVPVFNRKIILISQGLDPSSSENLSSFNRTNFWYRSGRMVYNFGQFIPQTNTLQDVKIYMFTPQFYLLEKIHAKEAHFENGDWVLQKGMVVTYPPETNFPLSMTFETKRKVIPEKPKDFKTLEAREDTMRLRDLRQYINRNREYGLDTTNQQVNYHERVALVFTPLVLVLLGFPFVMKPLKTYTTARSVAFCFGIVFLYLLMSRLTISVGKNGHIMPWIAAWAPNLLFIAVAGFRLMRS